MSKKSKRKLYDRVEFVSLDYLKVGSVWVIPRCQTPSTYIITKRMVTSWTDTDGKGGRGYKYIARNTVPRTALEQQIINAITED